MDDYKIIMLADDNHLTVKLDSVSVVGTDDYNQLTNIPKINNVEVKGNKALADYDIESASEAKKKFENLNSEINIQAMRIYTYHVQTGLNGTAVRRILLVKEI